MSATPGAAVRIGGGERRPARQELGIRAREGGVRRVPEVEVGLVAQLDPVEPRTQRLRDRRDLVGHRPGGGGRRHERGAVQHLPAGGIGERTQSGQVGGRHLTGGRTGSGRVPRGPVDRVAAEAELARTEQTEQRDQVGAPGLEGRGRQRRPLEAEAHGAGADGAQRVGRGAPARWSGPTVQIAGRGQRRASHVWILPGPRGRRLRRHPAGARGETGRGVDLLQARRARPRPGWCHTPQRRVRGVLPGYEVVLSRLGRAP